MSILIRNIFLIYFAFFSVFFVTFYTKKTFANDDSISNLENKAQLIISSQISAFLNYDNKLRHPSQLYEAFLEGIILFILINLIHFSKYNKIGTCSCMFLIIKYVFLIDSVTVGTIISINPIAIIHSIINIALNFWTSIIYCCVST